MSRATTFPASMSATIVRRTFFSTAENVTYRPDALSIRCGLTSSVPGSATWRTVPPGRVSRTFTTTPQNSQVPPVAVSEAIRPSPVGTVQPGRTARGVQSRMSVFSSQLQSGARPAGPDPDTGSV